MKAKEVILLIFIILLGVGFHYLQDFRISVDSWSFGHLKGQPYTFEENLILSPSKTLEILNDHGQVEVQGAEVNEISITLEKRVWARNAEEARNIAGKLQILTTESEDNRVISSNRNTFRKKSFETGFRLTVPYKTAVRIKNSHGPVRVLRVQEAEVTNKHDKVDIFEISGPVKVVNAFDDVSITDISGSCQVEASHASLLLSRVTGPVQVDCAHEEIELFDLRNSLNLESRHSKINAVKIAGPADISGSYEPISLTESTGAISIKGHHSPITVDNLKGTLKIENIYEPVKISNIEGDVTISGKSLALNGNHIRAKKIYVRTSYEDIRLDDFSGELVLEIEHGDVFLAPAQTIPVCPIEVIARYSDIKFIWPAGQTFPFQAQSRGGDVRWNLSLPYSEKKTNGTALLRAFPAQEEKPLVNLSTTFGTIKIEEKY